MFVNKLFPNEIRKTETKLAVSRHLNRSTNSSITIPPPASGKA
jgi:hypothetical protein